MTSHLSTSPTTPDESAFNANFELEQLNRMALGMPEEPIVIEVAKAVTIAADHPEVEASVLVTSAIDEIKAVLILRGAIGEAHRAKWNSQSHELVFPNGSAVVVRAAK